VPITKALGGRAEPRPTTFDRERAIAHCGMCWLSATSYTRRSEPSTPFCRRRMLGRSLRLSRCAWSDASELVARLRMSKLHRSRSICGSGGLPPRRGFGPSRR
jgi:hypothetical protein